MARSRKRFSIGSLIMCLIALICCVGLCVAEYFDLFTDNLYNFTNNIAAWPSKMSWYHLTKLIWVEKTSLTGELFFLFIVPMFLFWGIINLLVAFLETILSLLALILILILIIITWLFSTLVAFLFCPLFLILAIVSTIFTFKRNYSVINRIFGVSVSVLNLATTILFFIFAFSH